MRPLVPEHAVSDVDALAFAEVLVELGWLHDAEIEVVDALDAHPDDPASLSLFAKIKHIRGQLSQAIACWARLRAHSSYAERAQIQLLALMHMAEDPELGAGEYLAIGDRQLARKPSGQLALEQAFALFHGRRPDEARERCAEIAARYRASDPQTYKLAVLAGAWIAALTGDLEAAREILENLARERSFESDIDRLLALADVYQRLGTSDRLESAVRIYNHLEGIEGGPDHVWLLSRLAALCARLEDGATAREAAARFDAAFRRAMHRPTFAQTVSVAARRYLPLDQLRAIRFACHELPRGMPPRARALAAALTGDSGEARTRLFESSEPIDNKYLADIAVMHGEDDRATSLYLRTLADDPDDLLVVGRLLRVHARRPSREVARHFRKLGVFDLTRDNLEAAIRRAPLRPSLWRALSALHAIHGDDTEAARCDERAAALETTAAQRSHPIGRVLSIGVYHFIGQARGLVHEIWVHRSSAEPGRGGELPADHVLGNLSDDLKEGVRDIFLAVRELARTRFPHQTGDILDYDYSFKLPKGDEPSGGLSAGLPSALAFMSVFLQRPVPQDIALSGMLVSDAHDVLTVRGVGDVELKVAASYNRNLRGLILPAENAPMLAEGTEVPPAIVDELVSYAASFDDALTQVWGDDLFGER